LTQKNEETTMSKRWARVVLWGALSAAGLSLAAQAAPTPAAATAADKVERITVLPGNGARIEVLVQGQGPALVLLPSRGRGQEDFDDLAARLAQAGYRVLRPEPRGIGGSTR
jgi:hypothetical protein